MKLMTMTIRQLNCFMSFVLDDINEVIERLEDGEAK